MEGQIVVLQLIRLILTNITIFAPLLKPIIIGRGRYKSRIGSTRTGSDRLVWVGSTQINFSLGRINSDQLKFQKFKRQRILLAI